MRLLLRNRIQKNTFFFAEMKKKTVEASEKSAELRREREKKRGIAVEINDTKVTFI